MKRFVLPRSYLAALIIVILLAACSPVNRSGNITAVPATPVPPPTLTALPIVTDTPAPTPTITPTATQDAGALASGLGLPGDRSYSYDTVDAHPVLVDSSNQARRAIFENGQWRKLDYTHPQDAETMYGAMVPKDNTYLDTKEIVQDVDGALYHFFQVKAIYLGDIETGTVTYKNKKLSIPYILVGLRTADGNLHVFRFGSDSPDLLPPHYRSLSCQDVDGSDRIIILPEDMPTVLKALKLGARMKIDVLYGKNGYYPGVPKLYQSLNYALDNNYANMMMLRLIDDKLPEAITPQEGEALAQGKWPDRVITVYSIQGHTFEYMDCK